MVSWFLVWKRRLAYRAIPEVASKIETQAESIHTTQNIIERGVDEDRHTRRLLVEHVVDLEIGGRARTHLVRSTDVEVESPINVIVVDGRPINCGFRAGSRLAFDVLVAQDTIADPPFLDLDRILVGLVALDTQDFPVGRIAGIHPGRVVRNGAWQAVVSDIFTDVSSQCAHGEGPGQTEQLRPAVTRLYVEAVGLDRREVERLDVDEIRPVRIVQIERAASLRQDAPEAEVDDVGRGERGDDVIDLDLVIIDRHIEIRRPRRFGKHDAERSVASDLWSEGGVADHVLDREHVDVARVHRGT
jgi:hypothetical protein